MATWQFDICFVPKSMVAGKSISADELEDMRHLENLKIHRDSLNPLIGDMASLKSWSNDLEIYGHFDGDRIDVYVERSAISAVSARIDVRKIDKGFIQRLVEFANQNQLDIIDIQNRAPIEAQARSLLAAILNSKAKDFVDDPERFLDGFTPTR